jgi:hypothetical protein
MRTLKMKSLAKSLMFGAVGMVMTAGVLADDNGGMGAYDAAPNSLQDNRGNILCTAAINSTGTKAGGAMVLSSARSGVGTYQIQFKAPCNAIQAARGYARMVQPDTLTDGTLPARTCTTADRAGAPNGVFVSCSDGAGAAADTSFFLFVLR